LPPLATVSTDLKLTRELSRVFRWLIVTRTILVKPIGEDLAEDIRILRFHITSSLSKHPILQLLFDVSKEPPGAGNCVLTTIFARLGPHNFLLFCHIPLGGCNDPSICNVAMGRFRVTSFEKHQTPRIRVEP
jgi:hypothetical protein